MGLTPVQVMASLVTRMSVLACLAVGIGAAAGLALSAPLINLADRVYGIGAGLASAPPVDAVLAAAVLAAFVPARRAARMPVAATLGP
jgi:ABC-type antimicrobial peptide transport system permease subunit